MKWLASVLLCQLGFFGGTTQTNFICEMTSKCPVLPTRYLFDGTTCKWLASVLFCELGDFFVGTTWNSFSVCYISGFPDWISSYNSCKPDKGYWKCERCKYFAIQLLLQASVTDTKLTNLITGNKQWLFLNSSTSLLTVVCGDDWHNLD